MKRHNRTSYKLLSAGLLVSLLLSCSTEDEIREEVFDAGIHIGFNAPLVSMGDPEVSDMGTRSDIILDGQLPAGSSFGVIGYYQTSDGGNGSSSWVAKASRAVPTVFNTAVQEVTFDGTGCRYTPLKEWEEATDLYSFFAYWPYGAGKGFTVDNPTSASSTGAPVLRFTMPTVPASTGNGLSLDDTPDAMVAQVYDRQKIHGNINFGFNHLLTAIRFRVNNYDDTTPVIINSLYLDGSFNSEVTLDYTPVAEANALTRTTSGTYSGMYYIIGSGNSKSYEPDASSIVSEINQDNTTKEYTLLLLPDEAYSLGSVSIVCGFEFTNPSKTSNTTDISGWVFQPGYRYTINLNFIGDSYTISVATEDMWQNGTEDGNTDNEIIIQ